MNTEALTPNTAPSVDQQSLSPVPSRAALEGVGVAAQHFHGGRDHFIGRVLNTGEHRLFVTADGPNGTTNEAVGRGADVEAALQNSLEQMRTLETVRAKSLAHIEMTETSVVDFTTLEHYSPRVAPSHETYPVPSHLEGLLADDTRGNTTYENTVAHEGWQREIRAVLDDYLAHDPAGRALVSGLKISSLDHLTPEQAVKLSAAFVQNVSKYSYADLDLPAGTPTRADKATAQELLTEGVARKDDPDWEGNGVCRNVASNIKAVFESLKSTQGELSMLNNTYAVYGGGDNGAGYSDAREDNFSTSLNGSGHAWNTFVTIDARGSAAVTIVDATWALGKDVTAAVEHLDRTDVRAAAQIVGLFAKSERKPEAFEGLSVYADMQVRRSATNPRLSPAERDNFREYITTEYLNAAAQLAEIPEGYMLPNALMAAAYRLRGQLEKREVTALFALDKAGGSVERERMKFLIAGYDKDRKVPLPAWKSGDNLVFGNDELQALAYEAVGNDRVAQLAEVSGEFRQRLRSQRPAKLPAFDPYERRADAQELSHIASQSGIHDRDPRVIIRTMHHRIKKLAGDEAIYTAVIAGRSDYDLASSFGAITAALGKRKAQ